MLKNLSFISASLQKEIEALVGPSYNFTTRIKMRAVGSPRLLIHEASAEISKLLLSTQDLNYGNVELRQLGIIIRFQVRLETYGLLIPYYRLSFYQNGPTWSFHGEGNYIKATPCTSGSATDRFKMNLLQEKSLSQGDSGPHSSMN